MKVVCPIQDKILLSSIFIYNKERSDRVYKTGVSKETKKSKRSKYNRSKSVLQTQANRLSSTSILWTAKNTQPRHSYKTNSLNTFWVIDPVTDIIGRFLNTLQTSLQLMLVEKGGTQKTQKSFLSMSEN